MEDASNSSNFDRSDQHRYPEEKTASDGGTVIVPYHGVILPPPQSGSSTASGPQVSSTGLMGIRPAFKTDAGAVERMDQSSTTLAPLSSGQEWQPRSSPGSSEASLKRPAPGPLHLKQEEHGPSLKMGQTQQQSITDSSQTVFEAKRLKSEGLYHESAASSVDLPSISQVLRDLESWPESSQASYTKLRPFQDNTSDTMARRLAEPDTTSFRMSSSQRIGKLATRVVELANDTLSGGGVVSGPSSFDELAQKIDRVLEIVNESETLGDKRRQPRYRFNALTKALYDLDYQLCDTKMWAPVEIVRLPRVLEELRRVIVRTNDVDSTKTAAWAEMCPEDESVSDILDPLPGWSDLTLTVPELPPNLTETGNRFISRIQQAVKTCNEGISTSTRLPTYRQTKILPDLEAVLNTLSTTVESTDRESTDREPGRPKFITEFADPLEMAAGYIDEVITDTGEEQETFLVCFKKAKEQLTSLRDLAKKKNPREMDAWKTFFDEKGRHTRILRYSFWTPEAA